MSIKSNLPNLAKAFETLKLIEQINDKLEPKKSFLAYALKKAIDDKRPAKEILETLLSQIDDNKSAIENILGVQLVEKICLYGKSV